MPKLITKAHFWSAGAREINKKWSADDERRHGPHDSLVNIYNHDGSIELEIVVDEVEEFERVENVVVGSDVVEDAEMFYKLAQHLKKECGLKFLGFATRFSPCQES